MYGRRRSAFLEAALFFLSLCYRAALLLRAAGYRLGFLRSRRLPVRVISVGNITLGGTGKSPTAVNIASLFLSRGMHPVIVSRGYGRKDEKVVEVVSDGASGTVLGPDAAGDEPAMMARRLPGVPVVVGSDRYRAGVTAVARFHPDVIVLDDGYQHRRLRRDLDVVLIDASDPFGNSRLFPAGILREPLGALRRADIVLITQVDRASSLEALKQDIGRHTGAPVVTARYAPADIVDITTGEKRPSTALRGTRVFAFAGIARPEAFFSLLRSLGAQVTGVRAYQDHYRYTRSDLAGIFPAAVDSNATMIVTTEKDAVRLRNMVPEGIWALRVNLEVLERETWESVLLHKA
jgi:tetraacyldisaccharide 4'-kinase